MSLPLLFVGSGPGGGGAPPPPPENSCNDCEPPIPDTLYVTFTGLAGDFAVANGKQTLAWTSGCYWDVVGSGIDWLRLNWSTTKWKILLKVNQPDVCDKEWRGAEGDECDPWDVTYTEYSCIDAECVDTDSCEDSAGATAVVSSS